VSPLPWRPPVQPLEALPAPPREEEGAVRTLAALSHARDAPSGMPQALLQMPLQLRKCLGSLGCSSAAVFTVPE